MPKMAQKTRSWPRFRPFSLRKRSAPRRWAAMLSTKRTATFVSRKRAIRFMARASAWSRKRRDPPRRVKPGRGGAYAGEPACRLGSGRGGSRRRGAVDGTHARLEVAQPRQVRARHRVVRADGALEATLEPRETVVDARRVGGRGRPPLDRGEARLRGLEAAIHRGMLHALAEGVHLGAQGRVLRPQRLDRGDG